MVSLSGGRCPVSSACLNNAARGGVLCSLCSGRTRGLSTCEHHFRGLVERCAPRERQTRDRAPLSREDFSRSSHTGYPVRRLALQSRCRDWLVRCQYTVTKLGIKFDLQLLSERGTTYHCLSRARMHHKVVGNFGSEADVRSLYYRRFRFNETSDVGACTHGRPGK